MQLRVGLKKLPRQLENCLRRVLNSPNSYSINRASILGGGLSSVHIFKVALMFLRKLVPTSHLDDAFARVDFL